jgi:SNF2 family DNA or RNA helicase
MEKVNRHRKPESMTTEEWQKALRHQFATTQKFRIANQGKHPVFSDFEVFNPVSGKSYKVSIRDNVKSFNFCSCPDFTITALGTCKHVEYVLHYFSRYKKYQRYLNKPRIPEYSSLSIYYGQERKIKLRRTENSRLPNSAGEFFQEDGFLKPEMTDRLAAFITDARAADPAFVVYPDVIAYLERHQRWLDRKRISDALFSEGEHSAVFAELIRGNLYPYQKTGVRKMVETGRVLLADEMGLGKTLQAIAATEILARHFGIMKVLIICPTSVKYQWKHEIERFTERTVQVVEGLAHTRKQLLADDSFYKIISFGVCLYDLDAINRLNTDLVILDEAQRIKNWKTQTARAVKQIGSEFAFVLTGTPLENRIEELHSIVEYVDRYKLGPLFRFLDRHQVLDGKGKLKGYQNLRAIHTTLEDIMLRRTKKEIADQLPGRIDKNFFVEMTREQQAEHDSYYDSVSRLAKLWITRGYLTEEEQQRLLIGLGCMRMVCDTTYILNPREDHGNKIGELEDLLSELLENPENKIVIFSQWKRMMDLVIRLLDKLQVARLYLNGELSASERGKIIEDFRNNPRLRVFLSTDAGGVGVNLQSANILVNLDIPWNPAVLEQRIARIYRLGQKKHVNVFNFISRGSIEHRILYLLDFKKSVFTGVVEEEGHDTVMLEGFMESVKALTEINMEESSPWIHRPVNNAGNEQDIDPEKTAPHENEPGMPPFPVRQQEISGFFGRLRKKIGEMMSRLSGRGEPK